MTTGKLTNPSNARRQALRAKQGAIYKRQRDKLLYALEALYSETERSLKGGCGNLKLIDLVEETIKEVRGGNLCQK